ncbi:MAG: L,D-transpeptidase [Caldilineaceae bacterium]
MTALAIPAARAATPSFDDHAAGPGGDECIRQLPASAQPDRRFPNACPKSGRKSAPTWMTSTCVRRRLCPSPASGSPDFPIPDEERWIRVDLSEQTLIAYERNKPVRAFIISSGLPGTPTVTGEFRIRAKVRSQTMSGGSEELGTYYSLPNVQWVQYFYEDYGFHGSALAQQLRQPHEPRLRQHDQCRRASGSSTGRPRVGRRTLDEQHRVQSGRARHRT